MCVCVNATIARRVFEDMASVGIWAPVGMCIGFFSAFAWFVADAPVLCDYDLFVRVFRFILKFKNQQSREL